MYALNVRQNLSHVDLLGQPKSQGGGGVFCNASESFSFMTSSYGMTRIYMKKVPMSSDVTKVTILDRN